MNGYNPKYFNKNLLESMKSSLRDVIVNENNFAATRQTAQPAKKGFAGYGGLPMDKLSDLDLEKRMRETKRTSLFGPSKQSDEYLAYEAEANRRKAPAAAPTDVAVPGLRGQVGGPEPEPVMNPRTGEGYSTRMDNLPPQTQIDIMQQTTSGPQARRTGDAYKVQPERLPAAAKAEVFAATRTPQALARADERIAAASAQGVNPNTPGVVPVRPAGSAPSAPPARPVPQSMTSFTPQQASEISAAQNTPAARRLRGEKVPPRTSNPLIRPGGQYEPM